MEIFGYNSQCHVWGKKHNIKKAQYISTNWYTNCQAQWCKVEDLDLFCSCRTWASLSHWVDHELLSISKYFRVKFEAISDSQSLAGTHAHHAAGQWSQSISTTTTEWLKKKLMCCNGPLKGQTSTWLKCCSQTLRELCIMPQSSDKLKQHFIEEWVKIPQHVTGWPYYFSIYLFCSIDTSLFRPPCNL